MEKIKDNSYLAKLRDPRWQKKRLKILERDNWTCQDCRDTKTCLNVHHKRYEKGKDPWDYLDETLVTLCEVCHEKIKRSSKRTKLQIELSCSTLSWYPLRENFISALKDAVEDEEGFFTIVSMFALKKDWGVTIWKELQNIIHNEIHRLICEEAEEDERKANETKT